MENGESYLIVPYIYDVPPSHGNIVCQCSVCGRNCWISISGRRRIADGKIKPICPKCMAKVYEAERER